MWRLSFKTKHYLRKWKTLSAFNCHGLSSEVTFARSLQSTSAQQVPSGLELVCNSRSLTHEHSWNSFWRLEKYPVRWFSSKESSDEEEDSEIVGSANVKKLEEDPDLQENVDEEQEGQQLAKDFVSEETNKKDSESDNDDEEHSVSVMHKVIDAQDFLAQETFHDSAPSQQSPEVDHEIEAETVVVESASDRRRKLFWEYMENPTKNKHILNEILSPKSLDENEKPGLDKSDMVRVDDFADFLIDVRTSQKAVQSGAILKYRAMMVVGNFQGVVGFGLGKSSTIQGAITRARKLAFKSLIAIPLYRQHTIYEASSALINKTKILMWPRSRGFGVVANPLLYGCCDLIGIRDISIKVIGSRNRFNMVKGFFAALESIRSPLEIAEEKGVYMREVCLFRSPQTLKNFE